MSRRALLLLGALGVLAAAPAAAQQMPTMSFTGLGSDFFTIVDLDEGDSRTLTVALSAPLPAATTVELRAFDYYNDPGPTETIDYTISPRTLSFAAGQTRGTFTVSAVADLTTEGEEYTRFALVAPPGAPYRVGIGGSSSIEIFTIVDTSRTPGLAIESAATVGEGRSEAVTLRLGEPAPAGGTVVTLGVGGASTATETADFTLSATTLTIAAGDRSGQVTLAAVDDGEDDNAETIVLTAAAANPSVSAEPHTVRIVDNDPRAAPTAAPAGVTARWAAAGLVVSWTVPRPAPAPDYGVVVRHRARPGGSWSDHAATPAQRGAGRVTLRGLGALAHEVEVAFYVPDAEPGPGGRPTGPRAAAQVVAPTPTMRIDRSAFLLEVLTLGEGASVTVPVVLNVSLPVATTVKLGAVGSAYGTPPTETIDYTISPRTLSLAAGRTAGTITVSLVADRRTEGAESMRLGLVAPPGAPYQVPTDSFEYSFLLHIADTSRTPGLAIGSAATVGEGRSTAVTLRLVNPAPAGGTVVTLGAGGASTATETADFTLSATTLTIAAGGRSGQVTLAAVDDGEDDNAETVVLTAAAANPSVSAEPRTVRIVDNDWRAAPTAAPAGVTATWAGPGLVVSWTVPRPAPAPDYGVVVRHRARPGGPWSEDHAATTGQRDGGSVTLRGLGDRAARDVEVAFYVPDAEPGPGGRPGGSRVVGPRAAASVAAQGLPIMTFVSDAQRIRGGDAATVGVRLSAAAATDTTVTIRTVADSTTARPTDYTLSATTLTFAAGRTSAAFTVNAARDALNVLLDLELVAAPGAPYVLGEPSTHLVTIDRRLPLSLSLDWSSGPFPESSGSRDLLVRLTGSALAGGTVATLAIGGASTAAELVDFTLSATTVTFAPGAQARTVKVAVVDDAEDDNGETIVLTATSTNPSLTARPVTIRIVDDDPRAAPEAVPTDAKAEVPTDDRERPITTERKVSWNTPPSVAAVPHYGVAVFYRVLPEVEDVEWTERVATTAERDAGSLTVEGLLADSDYRFDVAFFFVDAEGTGGTSQRVDGPRARASPRFVSPWPLSARGSGDGELTFTWLRGRTGADFEITRTIVWWAGPGEAMNFNDHSRRVVLGTDKTSYTITGLTNDKEYRVLVGASNSSGAVHWFIGQERTGTPRLPPRLESLSVGRALTPAFAAGTTAYTVSVGAGVRRLPVRAVPTAGRAEMRVTAEVRDELGARVGAPVGVPADGSAPVALRPGAGANTVTVASSYVADPGYVASYAITVNRGSPGTVALSSGTLTASEGGALQVPVALIGGDPYEMVPVTVTPPAGAAPGDFTAGSYRFTIGGGNRTANLAVPLTDDAVAEPEERFAGVRLAVGPAPGFALDPARSEAVVTVRDDDRTAPVLRADRDTAAVQAVTVAEGAALTAWVALDTAIAGGRVTVALESAAAAAVTVAPASLTFTPADWDTPRKVTVTGVHDLDADDEEVAVTLQAASASLMVATRSVTVSVRDDERTPAAPAVTVGAGNAWLTVEWTPPADAGGAPVTAYRVRWRAENWASQTCARQASRCFRPGPDGAEQAAGDRLRFITGLANGTPYEVQVAAVNRHGTGAWAARSATPADAQAATLSFERATYRIHEGDTVTLAVALGGVLPPGGAKYRMRTRDGTAEAETSQPRDYSVVNRVFTIPAGARRHEVRVRTHVNASGGPSELAGETFTATITTAAPGVGIGATGTATITITEHPSPDAALSALSLSAGALSPAFAAGTTRYALRVPNEVAATTVTATAAHNVATLRSGPEGALTPARSGVPGAPLALAAGGTPNRIAVQVTAEDGAATRTYRVDVIRRLPPVAAPGGFTVTPAAADDGHGNRQAVLAARWQRPAGAVDGYRLQYRLRTETAWSDWPHDGDGAATGATLTGLRRGAAYALRVAARNATDTGAWATATARWRWPGRRARTAAPRSPATGCAGARRRWRTTA